MESLFVQYAGLECGGIKDFSQSPSEYPLTCIKEGFCLFYFLLFFFLEKEGHAVPVSAFCPGLHQWGFLSQTIKKSIHLQSPLKKWILRLQDLFNTLSWSQIVSHQLSINFVHPMQTQLRSVTNIWSSFSTSIPFVLYMPYIHNILFGHIRNIIWSTDEPNSGLWTVHIKVYQSIQ